MTDNYIHLIFKVKAIQNANIVNFVYCGKLDQSGQEMLYKLM